ncbi:MAG TPA: TlpA disulfide reductase family protein [Nitrospiria bacterium]|jgi:peroxiredoxin|nr:TlpA disulfide reductase family protein [Nitrospiria bacterium]
MFGLPTPVRAVAANDLYSRAGLTPVKRRIEPPDFSLKTPNGSVIDRQSLIGRVVLANFWATWCEPCKEEMPALQRLNAALSGEPFQVVGITTDDRVKAISEFTASLGLNFPILLDEQNEVSDALQVRGLPTTFLIGPDGRVLARAVGPRAWDGPEMLALIRSLMWP